MSQPSLFEPEVPRPERFGAAVVRHLERSQILTKANGSIRDFDYSLNPYIGCGFACTYCYASFFQADQERFDTWGTWVEAKANAVATLARVRNLKGKRVIMSSATDPYQPVEAKLELTRRILETLAAPERQPRIVVQTRGPLVVRDLDLLLRFDSKRVNMSITTDSEAVRKRFEPSCASIERRLEAISQVKEAGIETAICIMPMLPIENPARFAKRILEVRPDHVYAGGFRISDRPFAASTRPGALGVAKELGWNPEEYRKTVIELKSRMPQLRASMTGW